MQIKNDGEHLLSEHRSKYGKQAVMNIKKNRVANKLEGSPMPLTVLSGKSNSNGHSPNNAFMTDRLAGIEDIAQYDSSGMPFILVDNICVRTRPQLHSTLSKREKKCMRRVQRQCCVLPWLEHTRPATEEEPITPEEKEAREVMDFQADLDLIQLDMLRNEERSLTSLGTGTETPIAHAVSKEELLSNLSRTEEIRIQLEKLHEQQQNDPVEPVSLSDHMRIRRQATFDIEREEPSRNLSTNFSVDIHCPTIFEKRLLRATTISQLPRTEYRPSLQKMHSSTCLVKKSDSRIVLGTCSSPNSNSKARSMTFPTASHCDAEKYKQVSSIALVASPLQRKSRTFLKMRTIFKKIKN